MILFQICLNKLQFWDYFKLWNYLSPNKQAPLQRPANMLRFIRLCPNWLKSATFHLFTFDWATFHSVANQRERLTYALTYATVDRSKEAVCGIEEEKVSKDKVSMFSNCGKAKVADFGVGQHFMKIGENHSVRLAKHCRMRGWKWPWYNVKIIFLIKAMTHRFHHQTAISYYVSTSWSTGDFPVGTSPSWYFFR